MVFGFDIDDDYCIDQPDLSAKEMKKLETERQKRFKAKPSESVVIVKKTTIKDTDSNADLPKSPAIKKRIQI